MHNLTNRFFLNRSDKLLNLHSFPTRRSSDLGCSTVIAGDDDQDVLQVFPLQYFQNRSTRGARGLAVVVKAEDRKSTRLNSSHVAISYAIFCMKKKRIKSDDVRV